MPGETKADVSGWTTDTLKSHLDSRLLELDKRAEQRFDAQEKALKQALESAALAVNKAETTAEKWRENANEWRGTLSDRDRLLMPRAEAEQRLVALDEKISSVVRICAGATLFAIAIITVVLLIIRK